MTTESHRAEAIPQLALDYAEIALHTLNCWDFADLSEASDAHDLNIIARAILAAEARGAIKMRERCAVLAYNFDQDAPGSLERCDDPCAAISSWASEVISDAISKLEPKPGTSIHSRGATE